MDEEQTFAASQGSSRGGALPRRATLLTLVVRLRGRARGALPQ